jgi:hypothetical protein
MRHLDLITLNRIPGLLASDHAKGRAAAAPAADRLIERG